MNCHNDKTYLEYFAIYLSYNNGANDNNNDY